MARRKKQNEEEQQENFDDINNDVDDTFGLPEVDYQPLNRNEPKADPEPAVEQEAEIEPEPVNEIYEVREEQVESYHEEEPVHHDELVDEDHSEYKSAYAYMEEDRSPLWPKVVGIIVVLLLLAGGAYYYFGVHQPQQELRAEEARLEEANRAAEAKRLNDERIAAELRAQADQRMQDSLANLQKTGSLERLSGRTGRYYVVVASAIDDDLLEDYANKLVKQGSSVRIIPPFGKTKFHRLAIDDKETYEEAQASADGMKGGDFGNELWVVRY